MKTRGIGVPHLDSLLYERGKKETIPGFRDSVVIAISINQSTVFVVES